MTNSDSGLSADARDPARHRRRLLLGGLPDRGDLCGEALSAGARGLCRQYRSGRATRCSSSRRRRPALDVGSGAGRRSRSFPSRSSRSCGATRRPVTPSAAAPTAARSSRVGEDEARETAPRVGPAMRVPGRGPRRGQMGRGARRLPEAHRREPGRPAGRGRRASTRSATSSAAKDYAGGVAAFQINTQLYPDSANTYDSLGEALEASGDKAGAIAMYKKTHRGRREPEGRRGSERHGEAACPGAPQGARERRPDTNDSVSRILRAAASAPGGPRPPHAALSARRSASARARGSGSSARASRRPDRSRRAARSTRSSLSRTPSARAASSRSRPATMRRRSRGRRGRPGCCAGRRHAATTRRARRSTRSAATAPRSSSTPIAPTLFDRLHEVRDERGLTFVHPFDDAVVLAGAGTAGLEIAEDLPDAGVVVVPVGGGGLLGGVASAIRQARPAAPRRRGRARGGPRARSRARGGQARPGPRPATLADGMTPPFVGALPSGDRARGRGRDRRPSRRPRSSRRCGCSRRAPSSTSRARAPPRRRRSGREGRVPPGTRGGDRLGRERGPGRRLLAAVGICAP